MHSPIGTLVDLNELYFLLPDPMAGYDEFMNFHHWQAFLRGEDVIYPYMELGNDDSDDASPVDISLHKWDIECFNVDVHPDLATIVLPVDTLDGNVSASFTPFALVCAFWLID